jgi:hypothetical protein
VPSEGAAGVPGQSAFELAVANGFTGTEAEWLASLQGAPGAAGAAAPPNTVPSGNYTSLLSQISDWFQQLERTTRLEFQLRDQLSRTTNTTTRATLTAAINKATGKTTVTGGKFSYGGTTYYQESFINTTINNLQAKLKGLTA